MFEQRDLLKECLVALVEVINDPSSLKTVNLELLMHTRSEDSRVRIWALTCSEALWKTHGGKLIGRRSCRSTLTVTDFFFRLRPRDSDFYCRVC